MRITFQVKWWWRCFLDQNREFDDIEFKLRQSLQTKHFKILNNLEHILRWAKFEEFFFPKLFRIATFWVGGKLLMSCGRIAAEFRKPLVPWATVRGELLRAGRRQFVVSRVLPGDSKERHRCSTHTHTQSNFRGLHTEAKPTHKYRLAVKLSIFYRLRQ
jgi:hypothetical protein